MTDLDTLAGSHLRTYKTIFQHPISHNLEWNDVYALLGNIARVHEEANGNRRVTRNGSTLVLHPQTKKDVSTEEEVMTLRRFIKESNAVRPESNSKDPHLLLTINRHEARIFRLEVSGGNPVQLLPYAPNDHFRHAHNAKDFTRGQDRPDLNTYFEPVAKALKSPGHILIFGSGTGTGCEMDEFIAWAKIKHPDLTPRIIGSVIVDETHLSDGQILARAHEFYAKLPKT
jgi:hypothetical protein